jgi:hypothetical protein
LGTGTADSPIGDIRGKVVYAMRVTDKIPMHEYDKWAQDNLPEKRPDPRNRDPRRSLGDAIYDFSEDPPQVRPGVHSIDERERDLKGKYVLLSEHFFYFGNQPMALPEHLLGLVKHGQAHRSVSNAPYLEPFVDWLNGLGALHQKSGAVTTGGSSVLNKAPLLVVACNSGARPGWGLGPTTSSVSLS